MLRFRPILMTTAAAIFGAVPLAMSFGNGGEIRRPLGLAIVGGLIVSQLMTLYTTPVLYLFMEGFAPLVSAPGTALAWSSGLRHGVRAAPLLSEWHRALEIPGNAHCRTDQKRATAENSRAFGRRPNAGEGGTGKLSAR